MRRIRTVTILICILLTTACKRENDTLPYGQAPFLQKTDPRIDSLLAEMSLEEKIGQLIYVQTATQEQEALEGIIDGAALSQIGGLDLQGFPIELYLDWKDRLEELSKIPLFWGTRQELLLNAQFSDLETFPSALTVNAANRPDLLKEIRYVHLDQLERLGLNWAPASDPLSEIRTPEEIDLLSKRRILSVASWSQYEKLIKANETASDDFVIYRNQAIAGLCGLRVTWTPSLQDSLANRTAFLRGKLLEQSGFDGLVIGELEKDVDPAAFLKAGADQLIAGSDWKEVWTRLYEAAKREEISEEELNSKVRRIIAAKDWMLKPEREKDRAEEFPPIVQASFGSKFNPGKNGPFSVSKILQEHFNDPNWVLVKHALYRQSMILLSNPADEIPFDNYKKLNFQISHYSDRQFFHFNKQFEKYADYDHQLLKPEEEGRLSPLNQKTKTKNAYIVLIDQPIEQERDAAFIKSLLEAAKQKKLAVINFGPAQNLQVFDSTLTLIQIYERNKLTEEMAAQALFGALDFHGRSPETINTYFQKGSGLQTVASRLAYSLPQEAGVAPEQLVGIDAIMNTAVDNRVIPGGQVLVAKESKIIYSKAFGYHTFSKRRKVQENDLYDLASITKVAATTLAAMQLYDLGRFELDDRLKNHLDLTPEATIKNITIKRLLMHQSGLQANMPIASYAFPKTGANMDCTEYFCREKKDNFSVEIASNFYFNRNYLDSLWLKVQTLRLRSSYYRYSDVNFILLQKLIENKTNTPLDAWTARHFFDPLGLRYTTFNPLRKFPTSQIAPTQKDNKWRNQLLHGYVHDESAALLGGVGGNAGLFSSAEDLAVVFQMLLNRGVYGGRRYLQAGTVDLFTSAGHGNHRGLGFDKPGGRRKSFAYSELASPKTFGHTGFTGPCVWVDPEHDLIFIFITNRIYPNRYNRAFSRSNIRQRIHDVVYNSLRTFNPQVPQLPKQKVLSLKEG